MGGGGGEYLSELKTSLDKFGLEMKINFSTMGPLYVLNMLRL